METNSNLYQELTIIKHDICNLTENLNNSEINYVKYINSNIIYDPTELTNPTTKCADFENIIKTIELLKKQVESTNENLERSINQLYQRLIEIKLHLSFTDNQINLMENKIKELDLIIKFRDYQLQKTNLRLTEQINEILNTYN